MRTTTAIAATGLILTLCAANVGIGAADTVSSHGEPQWSAAKDDPVSKYLDLPLANSQGEFCRTALSVCRVLLARASGAADGAVDGGAGDTDQRAVA